MITRHSKKPSFNFLFELLGSLLIRSSQEDYPRFFSNKTQTILYFLLSRIIPILLLRFLESSACIIRNSSKDSYTRNRPLYDTCFAKKKNVFGLEAIAREISQPNPIKIEPIHAPLVESSSRKTVKLRGLWVTSARIAPRNRLTTKIAERERERGQFSRKDEGER